jgi:hypothetical protein
MRRCFKLVSENMAQISEALAAQLHSRLISVEPGFLTGPVSNPENGQLR